MEEDEMPAQGCKFPRNHNNSNGKMESVKGGGVDEEDGDEDVKRGRFGSGQGQGRGRGGNISSQVVDISNSGGPLCNWPASRIFRVSRASGGKDRHSKVWTSKGLRDRRVRLSVPTAIQFYDLQDRLGYDQPSKAVEWLLTAASTSISELPSISTPFPDTPQQLTDGRRSTGGDNEKRFDLADVEVDGDDDENMMMQQEQEGNGNVVKNLCKSGCSSTSETSKGSGLSFSRPESRIKARERARERAAGKEKEKEKEEKEIEGFGVGGSRQRRLQNLNPISQNSSFTELLTGGGGNGGHNSPNGNGHVPQREWISPSSTSMDYFGTGLLSSSTSRPPMNFLGQIQLGNPIHQQFSVTGDQNQQYSFLPDHLVVRGGGGGGGGGGSNSNNNNGDYNLNFSVTCSSGLVGFNRGTLQSNSSSSPSMLPHHHNQRFSNIDGTSPNFFLSPTTTPVVVTNASSAHVTPVENQYHHFLSGFDPQLQLCYDNNTNNRHHLDHKGKGKNSAS